MVRMAIIKIFTNDQCWREGGEKGTLPHCWWESNLIQPQWRKASGKSLQSCLFCNPMDCIPPCPCVHGIFHPILQGIFPTQGWSPCLLCPLHWQKGSLPPGPPGSLEVPYIYKNRFTIWPCNPTPGHISREKHDLKGYMHPNVHCSTVYNSQDMEAT